MCSTSNSIYQTEHKSVNIKLPLFFLQVEPLTLMYHRDTDNTVKLG